MSDSFKHYKIYFYDLSKYICLAFSNPILGAKTEIIKEKQLPKTFVYETEIICRNDL